MWRKPLVGALLCFLVIAVAMPAGAARRPTPPPPPNLTGTSWDITSGTMKVTATVPFVMKITVDFLNVGLLKDAFYFYTDNGNPAFLPGDGDSLPDFFDKSLGLYGSWSQTGASYKVDLMASLIDLIAELKALVEARCGAGSTDVTITRQEISGTATPTKISARLSASMDVAVTCEGLTVPLQVQITGSLTGAPGSPATALSSGDKSGEASSVPAIGLAGVIAQSIFSALGR
jgi:hypothetical protein